MTSSTHLPPLPLIDNVLFIDNSWIEKEATCPRSTEYYSLHKRILVDQSPALTFGAAIHSALEYRYKNDPDLFEKDKTEQGMITACAAKLAENPPPPDDHRTLELASKVLHEYNIHYGCEDFRTLVNDKGEPFVEQPFAFPLFEYHIPSPMPIGFDHKQLHAGQYIKIFYQGKIDLAVEESGQRFIVDHKTTSMMGSQYFDEMAISSQQEGYCWAYQQATGKLPSGFILNALAIRRPTKTGKTIEFARQREYIDQSRIDEWKHNTIFLVEEFLWEYSRGYLPQKKKWCVGKYGKCPYYDVCKTVPEQRLLLLNSGLYVENKWTPLNLP